MEQTAHPELLSVMIPAFHSEHRLRPAVAALTGKLEAEQIPFELLIIDDGSKDNTWAVAQQLAKEDTRVRAFRLSRNYTSPYVHFAGFSVCKGACVTSMPDDLQRPLDTLVACYRKWQEGHKLVVSYRVSRDDGWWSDLFSGLYYRIMNSLSDVSFPPGGTDGVNLYSAPLYIPYRWQHLVCQRRGSTLEMYLDGQFVGDKGRGQLLRREPVRG